VKLTLFDLDNTLLAGDSDYEWGQFLIERGVLSRADYEAQNARFFEQYKAGTLDIHEYLGFALGPLAAHAPEELARWHDDFMRERVRPMLLPRALELVARHLAAGDLCAIVTATNSFVTAPIAREFGVPHLVATEPVYVVAVFGDDVFAASNNQGRDDFEACLVDAVTGHLACSQWQVQGDTDPQQTFGMDAVLYFSYLYPFYGVNRETTGAPTTRTFLSSAIGRFPVLDLVTATMNLILGNRQSASTSFELNRSYYQMTRLMAYVFVIGGWGDTSPPGPTGTVERHIQ